MGGVLLFTVVPLYFSLRSPAWDLIWKARWLSGKPWDKEREDVRRMKGCERKRKGMRWHFAERRFPSKRVSLLPIKGKVFSVDPYASEKTTETLFFILLSLLKTPSLFSYFALFPLQKFILSKLCCWIR